MKYVISVFLYISLLFSPVVLHAKLYPIQNYFSFKLGYTGLWAKPLKLKGPYIIPATGKEYTEFTSTGAASFSLGSYYSMKYIAVRGEAEYAFRLQTRFPIQGISASSQTDTISVNYLAQTALLNVFLDANTSTFFVPYIGIGVGISIVESKHSSSLYTKKGSNIDLAWMATLGAAFYINKTLAIDVQTRYTSLGNQKKGSQIRLLSSLQVAEVFVGVRYTL
ncbi:MAG: outer membrane protein [Desulfovibrionaceae bacterium]